MAGFWGGLLLRRFRSEQRMAPFWQHRPPLAAIPDNAADVRLQWILGNAFYVIDYRVASGPPFVDLDLPIPGKGDSLRSRYYASPL